MARPIGIDLGSSTCVAAVVDPGAPGGTRLLTDALGEARLAAAIHFGEAIHVGEEARILAPAAPAHTLQDFTPLLGRPYAGATCLRAQATMAARLAPIEGGGIGVVIGDTAHPLTGPAAMLLSTLRSRAEATAARVTVPATAGPGPRRAIRAAAQRAGFDDPRLVSTPLAIAAAADAGRRGPERLWVVDVGAHAVEVAAVDAAPALVELRGAVALAEAGGRAIDLALTDLLVAQCVQATGVDPRRDRAALEVLRREAEWARIALDRQESVDVQVAALMFADDRPVDLRARLDAAALAGPMRALIDGVRRAVAQIEDAAPSDGLPARLALVGGLTRAPALRAGLAAALGLAPDDLDPLTAAARGAARIAAAATDDPIWLDASVEPLRIGRVDGAIVIPGGMPLPVRMGRIVSGGEAVSIWHGADAADADHLLGQCAVEQPSRLVLDLDPDGVLDVTLEPLPRSALRSTGAPSAPPGPPTSRRPTPVAPVERSPSRSAAPRPASPSRPLARFPGAEKKKPPPAEPTGVGAKGGSRTPTS